MPSLVVISQVDGYRVFEINKERIVIGRGEDADLMLPNISVSRHHAEVSIKGHKAYLQDLNSSNGTLLNGKRVQEAQLKSGDEIALGKFRLAYMGDGTEDRFFKGRYLEYMLKYDATANRGVNDSTFSMSPEEIRKKQIIEHRMRSAKLVLNKNSTQFWFPEDRGLTLGGDGMIPVEGLFTGGVVAEITWNGKTHILHKRARFLKVMVNDQSKSEHPLQSGDRVRVGGTNFRYEIAPMD